MRIGAAARAFALVVILIAYARVARAVDYVLTLEPPLDQASVSVDGNFAGTTDENGKIIIFNGVPGPHVLRVQIGNVDVSADYVFDATLNDLAIFEIGALPTLPIARYLVNTGVSDATIFVDGSAVNAARSGDGTAAIELTPERTYRIAAAREGYAPAEIRVKAVAGGGLIGLPLRQLGGEPKGGPDPVLLILALALAGSVIVLAAVFVVQLRRRSMRPNAAAMDSVEQGVPLFDRYRVVSTLGSGGVAMIYRAVDVVEKSTVALKVLDARWLTDPEMVRKFLSEGEVLRAVAERDAHNFIVRCYRHGREHGSIVGRPFIALELLEGETLQARLKREPFLQELTAAGIAFQIASALTAVHAAGIVHRDLTPDNIFLRNGEVTIAGHTFTGVPRVVLIDFGIARLEITTNATMDGSIAGKPQYMSPEQCRGLAVDARSDLYSLGIILFLMAAGRTPFDGRDPFEVMRAQQADIPPALPPHVSPQYVALTHRLLAKEVHARPQSAALVASELQSLFVQSGPAFASANLVPFPERRSLP
jgi:serine/threonine-protein kinase